MDETPWYETVTMPALLRHSRDAYGVAMRRALDAAGFDDMPKNGLYVVGALALSNEEAPLGDIIRSMRVSKQAAGQLIDALVTRGYLDRAVDADDRRKLTVTLTDRGRAAAATQAAVRESIDAELLATLGRDDLNAARRTLATLCDIGRQREEA